MASQPVGENTVFYGVEVICSVHVHGHHISCQIWTPTIEEILLLQIEPDKVTTSTHPRHVHAVAEARSFPMRLHLLGRGLLAVGGLMEVPAQWR